MANTVHNFWAMVQECDVHLIVMLTEVSGASKASASIPYWPQNDGSSLELGEFTITKRFSSESGSYTTTTLQLTHGPSKKVRRVWHLQYSGWQDHGCPEDVGEYLTFMEELSALRRHTVSEVAAGKNRNTPVLVHCSAGVGRTGVTILSDILRYCADHNIDIDIPKVKCCFSSISQILSLNPGSFTLATTKDVDGANRCPVQVRAHRAHPLPRPEPAHLAGVRSDGLTQIRSRQKCPRLTISDLYCGNKSS